MELVATLIADLPLDERRFHGLLHDIAAVASVAAITPSGLSAKHYFRAPSSEDCPADCLLRVAPASALPDDALKKLRDCGFRPHSILKFQLGQPQKDLGTLWDLLKDYVNELQGWVLTAALDFDQAVARCGSEEGLMQLSHKHGDGSKAVLISATTMRQLEL